MVYARKRGGSTHRGRRFISGHRLKTKVCCPTYNAFSGPRTGTRLALGTYNNDQFEWPQFNDYTAATGETCFRNRNNILLNGILIDRTFEYQAWYQGSNRYTSDLANEDKKDFGPIVVTYLVVQNKKEGENISTVTDKEDFFRDNFAADRTLDFVDAISTTTWREEYVHAPLNLDSNLKVLMKKKFILDPKPAGGVPQKWPSVKRIRTYMKIGKTISFGDNTETSPEHQMYEIFWCETLTPWKHPAASGSLNEPTDSLGPVATYSRSQTYFNDEYGRRGPDKFDATRSAKYRYSKRKTVRRHGNRLGAPKPNYSNAYSGYGGRRRLRRY